MFIVEFLKTYKQIFFKNHAWNPSVAFDQFKINTGVYKRYLSHSELVSAVSKRW